jgi:hypothetical protein
MLNLERSGKIWKDLERSGKIWKDLERSGKNEENITEGCRTSLELATWLPPTVFL